MSDVVQYLLAGLIVMAAVVAVVRSLVRTVRNKSKSLTACAGCKLQDICQKTEKNSAKKCADKVAQVKKSQ
jgi:hypothetical protein